MTYISRKLITAQPLTLEEADAIYRARTEEQDHDGFELAVDDADDSVGLFVEACLAAVG